MNTKICIKCGEEKPLGEYSKDKSRKDGLQNKCKLCLKQYYQTNKEHRLEQQKQYYQTNKERIAEYRRQHYQENKERINERHAQHYQTNKEHRLEQQKQHYQENKEQILEQRKQYRQENKERINEQKKQYTLKRRNTDPLFRLKENIRRLIRWSLSNNGYTKKSKTHEILGCSYEDFKHHIESQFEPWMTWENYGEWELDHNIPVSSYEDEDELIKLNHYTNLQPMEATKNRIKGDSYLEEDKQRFLEQLSRTLKIKQ